MSRRNKKKFLTFVKDFSCYVLITLITIFCIFPIAWIIKTSFETPQFIRNPQIQWIPIKFTLGNYLSVLSNPNAMLGRSFINSLIISLSSTFISLVITTMAAGAVPHQLNIHRNAHPHSDQRRKSD